MVNGTSWIYHHFIRHEYTHDTTNSKILPPDTIQWLVIETTQLFGTECYLISITQNSRPDTILAAYRIVPDSGLFLWALDSMFSGQEILRIPAQNKFKKYNHRRISSAIEQDSVWNYNNNTGQLIEKKLTLLDLNDTLISVMTTVNGAFSYQEIFSPQGLIQRVYAREKFFDDIAQDTVSIIDSFVLFNYQ